MPKVAYSEAQREQIRRDLVAVGLELMTKQGIQHTTVEQIYQKVGISRSFFYKNAVVNMELNAALKTQQGKILSSKRDKKLNEALKETVKLQKDEIEKLRMEKSRLTFEIKRLKTEQQNDLDFSLIEKL